jgi:hypothetical protein
METNSTLNNSAQQQSYYTAYRHKLYSPIFKVLRRIFGTKSEEVTGEWRKLRNEEHHNLQAYCSPR